MTALRMLSAAIALTLSMSAFAQEAKPPLYQIYGTLNVNLQYTQAKDATIDAQDVSGRWAVSSDSTNIGIRGTLDATPAIKVVYQCETAAGLDASSGSLCGRNSRVGLSGDWGTLFYGNWDTPFKAGTYGTKADDPFGNTDVFAYQGIMGSPGQNARSGAWTGAVTHSFDLRAANSVAYWTPKFSGLSAKLQWSTDEAKTATGVVNPTLYSAAVNYDMAGLSLVASGEYHEDGFGLRSMGLGALGPPASNLLPAKDFAWRVAAGYELPLGDGAFTVMGMVEQLILQQDSPSTAATIDEYKRIAWLLGAKFRMGPHEFRGRFAMADDGDCSLANDATCEATDAGASQYALGYAYHLAKTTQLFAFYTQILNEDAAAYTFSIGGSPAVAGSTPAGADPMAAGVGIRYAF